MFRRTMKISPFPSALPALVIIAMVSAATALSVAEESAPTLKQKPAGQPASMERPSPGTTIYKSVDARGRVTYGDEPNPHALKEEQVNLPSYVQSISSAESRARLEAMAATTKRLQEDRRARQEERRKDTQRSAPAPVAHYPPVVVQNRGYRPSRYDRQTNAHPYPHAYPGAYPGAHPPYRYPGNHDTHRKRSSIGVNISGGSSTFRYGVSLGNQQSHQRSRSIRTPYRSGDWERH